MIHLDQYINESAISKEEARADYGHVDGCDSKKDKQVFADKYGCTSLKKGDIQHAILIKLRELRKSASSFTKEDYTDFMRLNDYTILKIADYLKEEGKKFIDWLMDFYKEEILGNKLQNWIGQNPTNAYNLSYSDKDKIKRYNKMLEYVVSVTPKTRTSKDEIFDLLVNKFTDLLENYKKEYLTRVERTARDRYTKIMPQDLEKYKKRKKELQAEIDKVDWRNDRYKWDNLHEAKRKVENKIEKIANILHKYTEDSYVELCIKNATEEFEHNIKILAQKIQDDELEVDKLDVKSVHDDPKVFNMKITDGTKNLYCRSVLAAEFSTYMIPHYRFIITNRSKDDSKYID